MMQTINKKIVKYEALQEYSSNDYHAFYNGRKWGFINNEGILKIKPQFEECCGFYNGLAGVKKKDKWGFIDKNNNTVIPFMYEIPKNKHRLKRFYDYNKTRFLRFEGELLAPVAQNNLWGFINTKNEIVIPFRYENVCIGITSENSKLFCVKLNGKWGFIDKKRNVVIKFIFDNAEVNTVNAKYYTVFQKTKNCENFGLVDGNKGLILPCKYRFKARPYLT